MGAKGFAGGATQDSTPRKRVPSIEDSPGYVRPFDPESTSILIGRRTNAPLVGKRFQGGERSLDALGRAVCRALHRGSRDSLFRLVLRDDEFREVLWREFPQSRPATGLTWEDAWRVLDVRLLSGCNQALNEFGGRYHQFIRIEADSIATYKNFRLYSRLKLVVKDDQGQIQEWTWIRAIAERKGVFKIYSTED